MQSIPAGRRRLSNNLSAGDGAESFDDYRNKQGRQYPALLYYGVKSIDRAIHVPLRAALEHSTIVALSGCPLGSYVKTGKLTIRVSPGGRLGCVSVVLQPSRLIKSSEVSGRTVPVAPSLRSTNIDSKASPPVFCNARSVHQPVPVQLSSLLKDAVKPGDSVAVAVGVGVDVAEGVEVGVGVDEGVDVGVSEDVAVGESVGVDVTEVVGVEVSVVVGVTEGVTVTVGEAVCPEDVGVDVGGSEDVGVIVGEAVGIEEVGVNEGVAVGVEDGSVNVGVKVGVIVRVGV